MKPKAIQDEMGEVFDEYGRMSAKLGLELPFTTALNQTFVVQNFVDPATEIVYPNDIQIWKITHNGVDTHPVHFHLFDVQVINRVGWDGFIEPARRERTGLEGNGPDQPAAGYDRRSAGRSFPRCRSRFPTAFVP